MFKYQDENDIGIYDGQNKYLIDLVAKNNYKSKLYKFMVDEESDIYIKDNKIYYEGSVIYDGDSKRNLIGTHNLKNIMVVLLISKLLGLDINKAINVINSFKPLEHRLEMVGTYNDITYFNDTIATIPEATINGINGLGNVDTLIFGGLDRKIDYSGFVEFLRNSDISNLIGIPDTGYDICDKLNGSDKNIFKVETLDEAVDLADKYTKKGCVCLLSPAATSYNRFKNFEEKGNYYKTVIKNKYEK